MKTQISLLLAAVLALMLTCSARATVIFDSTTTAADDYGYIAGGGAGSGYLEEWIGQSFTVGGSSATLSSVVLSMDTDNTVIPSGNFFVSLYDATGAGSNPGADLLTLSGSANPATAGNYTYTGSYLLAADTTYYIVAGVSSGTGAYEWAAHDSLDNGTIGYSTYLGAGWNLDNTPVGAVYTDSTFNMQVNADITPAPEPSELGLVSCGALAGLVCIVERRRRSPMTHQK